MTNLLERVVDKSSAPTWLGAYLVATALGLMLSAIAPHLPGTEPLSLEDPVDAVGFLALGGLGVGLVRRGVAAGLGRALVLTAALVGIVWLSGGLSPPGRPLRSPPSLYTSLARSFSSPPSSCSSRRHCCSSRQIACLVPVALGGWRGGDQRLRSDGLAALRARLPG
jgi:hypothetical protein